MGCDFIENSHMNLRKLKLLAQKAAQSGSVWRRLTQCSGDLFDAGFLQSGTEV